MSHPLPMALALAMSFSCFSSCDRPYVETAGSPMVHSSIAPLVISEERSYRVRVALQPKSMYAGSHSEPAAIDSLVDGEVTLGALLRLQHQEASPATTATPIEAVFSCGDVRVVARFASRTARTPTGIRSESTAMAFELMAEELSGLHANY